MALLPYSPGFRISSTEQEEQVGQGSPTSGHFLITLVTGCSPREKRRGAEYLGSVPLGSPGHPPASRNGKGCGWGYGGRGGPGDRAGRLSRPPPAFPGLGVFLLTCLSSSSAAVGGPASAVASTPGSRAGNPEAALLPMSLPVLDVSLAGSWVAAVFR